MSSTFWIIPVFGKLPYVLIFLFVRDDSPEGLRNSRGRYDSGRSYDRYSRERSPDRWGKC